MCQLIPGRAVADFGLDQVEPVELVHRAVMYALGPILTLKNRATSSGRRDQLGLEPAAQLSLTNIGPGGLGQGLFVVLEQRPGDIRELLDIRVCDHDFDRPAFVWGGCFSTLGDGFPESGTDDLKLYRLDKLFAPHQVFDKRIGRGRVEPRVNASLLHRTERARNCAMSRTIAQPLQTIANLKPFGHYRGVRVEFRDVVFAHREQDS